MLSCLNLALSTRHGYGKKSIDLRPILINIHNSFSSSIRPKTHYEVLNLTKNCSSKEIREAFITLSKQCHPDKNKDNPKAQDQFVKVNEAYNVLIKPDSRRDYDSTIHYGSERFQPHVVHRYDTHYQDPWKDPSFARNRNFAEEDKDRYYGVKGIRRQTNDRVLLFIMLFAGVGLFVQISVIRFSSDRYKANLHRVSEENRQHIESLKARSDSFDTREEQIEAFQQRLNLPRIH